jgi:nucleotide-binding universal stress UspA family protein
MTRLLLAYDDSAPARVAIETAAALFAGAEAVVATVYPPTPSLATANIARIALPESMIRDGIEHMRAERVHGAQTLDREGVAVATAAGLRATEREIEASTPWRALAALADELAVDAIVCGTRGNGAIDRVLLGSTATSLLNHADRPLLVVPDHSEPSDGPVLVASGSARGGLAFATAHLPGRRIILDEADGDWHTELESAKSARAAAILVRARSRVAARLVHAAALPVIVVPEGSAA